MAPPNHAPVRPKGDLLRSAALARPSLRRAAHGAAEQRRHGKRKREGGKSPTILGDRSWLIETGIAREWSRPLKEMMYVANAQQYYGAPGRKIARKTPWLVEASSPKHDEDTEDSQRRGPASRTSHANNRVRTEGCVTSQVACFGTSGRSFLVASLDSCRRRRPVAHQARLRQL